MFLSAPADGQPAGRTKAGAQAFLSQALVTGRDDVLAQTPHGDNFSDGLRGRITAVSGSGCRTTFHAQTYPPQLYGRPPGQNFDVLVDWDKVDSVGTGNAYAVLNGAIHAEGRVHQQLLILVPSVEMAARVKTAAEFLRVSCDASRSTGF